MVGAVLFIHLTVAVLLTVSCYSHCACWSLLLAPGIVSSLSLSPCFASSAHCLILTESGCSLFNSPSPHLPRYTGGCHA